MDHALDTGRARIALWVPSGFGEQVSAGRIVQIYAGLDGADANTANVAQGYLNGVVQKLCGPYHARPLPAGWRAAGLRMPLEIAVRVLV